MHRTRTIKPPKEVYAIPEVVIAGPGQTVSASAYGLAVASPKATAKVAEKGVAYASEMANAHGGMGAVALGKEYAFEVKAGDYGVARVIDVGRATAGKYGVSIVTWRGAAHSGNGGISVIGSQVKEGWPATSGVEGIAAVRCQGRAIAGKRGIAVAWNDRAAVDPEDPMNPTSNAGIVSAGEGGLLVAFGIDPKTGKRRMIHEEVSVGGKCQPGKFYRLKSQDGELAFGEVDEPKRLKR